MATKIKHTIRHTVLPLLSVTVVSFGLSSAAFAALSGAPLTQERLEELCKTEEFTPRELRKLLRSDLLDEILLYTAENCPAVAALITDVATETTNPEGD
ncbi:MAG: hypothetical protein KDE08_00600, partial [Rhodobacteraceae bacterium]|nr:hypothetical protein [Paracoccaceae bacterium]